MAFTGRFKDSYPPAPAPASSSLRPHQHTVGSVLATSLPRLLASADKPPLPFRSKLWVDLDGSRGLGTWTDFTYQTISDAFGDVLSLPAELDLRPINIPILTVEHLKAAQVNAVVPLLRSPLEIGSAMLEARRDLVAGGIDVSTHLHIGIFKPTLTFTTINPDIRLVHSATRRLISWSSANIGRMEEGNLPIQHVATFAAHGKTRYGFVFTEAEVVVVRTSLGEAKDTFIAEWQSVPLDASREGTLTPALAIWALVMLSRNTNHRAVVRHHDVVPISRWSRVHDGWVHSYSGRKLDTPPPSATFN